MEFISSRLITNCFFGLALSIAILCNIFSFIQVSKLGEAFPEHGSTAPDLITALFLSKKNTDSV